MRKVVLVLNALLLLSSICLGHRLNEYLQATTISLEAKSIVLKMQLTPGTDVAGGIINSIDENGDGLFSPSEQLLYAQQVSKDISVFIDGKIVKLSPTSYSFPIVQDIKKGIGEIDLTYSIRLNDSSNFHQLKVTNHHLNAIAVYLVNCLLPTDTSIHVTDQIRNADQSVYQLNFSVRAGNSLKANSQRSLNTSTNWAVVKTYFVHGVNHILTGYDHLLFLCALVLGAAGLWDLIKIVTAFTIAHSITLTLATYGLAHLPEQIVEPFIAASIVFVAIQNVVWPESSNGYIRLAVAFFFGLFHGLGFAGGLVELMHAMPNELIVFAIIGFSIGVEAGNQLVLIPLFLMLELNFKPQRSGRRLRNRKIRQYASFAVAIAGTIYIFIDLYRFLKG